MKVAVFTITCDRIDFTKKYLCELRKNAGMQFEHIIVDNNSTDGTVEFLLKAGYTVIQNSGNVGILKAMQQGITYILQTFPSVEYIVKFDNDCKIRTKNILKSLIESYEIGCKSKIIAPYDLNILPAQHPRIFAHKENILQVSHVGGIFVVMPRAAAKLLLYHSPKLIGGDLLRGRFWISKGFDMIYRTDLEIEHKGIGNQTKNYKLC
jgi:glycosyltransferase involved in cell wall biosynthesis